MLRKKTELTPQEKIFLSEYIKTSNGIKALNVAYPKSINWSYNAQHVQVNKLLNKPKIDLRLKQHNEAEAEALKNSTLLNKRKILNEIIELQQNCKEAGQGQSAVNLQALKLLAQIAKLLDTTPTINNNIQINNNTMNNINNFLDL